MISYLQSPGRRAARRAPGGIPPILPESIEAVMNPKPANGRPTTVCRANRHSPLNQIDLQNSRSWNGSTSERAGL